MQRNETSLTVIAIVVAALAWLLPLQPVGKSPLVTAAAPQKNTPAEIPTATTVTQPPHGQISEIKLDEEGQWLYEQTIASIDEQRVLVQGIQAWMKENRVIIIESPQAIVGDFEQKMVQMSNNMDVIGYRSNKYFDKLIAIDLDREKKNRISNRYKICWPALLERWKTSTDPLLQKCATSLRTNKVTPETFQDLESLLVKIDSFLGDVKGCHQFGSMQ